MDKTQKLTWGARIPIPVIRSVYRQKRIRRGQGEPRYVGCGGSFKRPVVLVES